MSQPITTSQREVTPDEAPPPASVGEPGLGRDPWFPQPLSALAG